MTPVRDHLSDPAIVPYPAGLLWLSRKPSARRICQELDESGSASLLDFGQLARQNVGSPSFASVVGPAKPQDSSPWRNMARNFER